MSWAGGRHCCCGWDGISLLVAAMFGGPGAELMANNLQKFP